MRGILIDWLVEVHLKFKVRDSCLVTAGAWALFKQEDPQQHVLQLIAPATVRS